MADTINDILVSNSSWVDIYTVTSITQGSDVSICNKGTSYLYYQESSTQPDDADDNGVLIGTMSHGDYQAIAESVTTKIWLKAKGLQDGIVNIQEI